MKTIVWLSVLDWMPERGYWDQHLLERIFSDCEHKYSTNDLKEAIVVIPGANQGEFIDQINIRLSKLEKAVVIVSSDEGGIVSDKRTKTPTTNSVQYVSKH